MAFWKADMINLEDQGYVADQERGRNEVREM